MNKKRDVPSYVFDLWMWISMTLNSTGPKFICTQQKMVQDINFLNYRYLHKINQVKVRSVKTSTWQYVTSKQYLQTIFSGSAKFTYKVVWKKTNCHFIENRNLERVLIHRWDCKLNSDVFSISMKKIRKKNN